MAPVLPLVVGSPRSGTTLLRLMLDQHPDLAMMPESRFVIEMWTREGHGADPVAPSRYRQDLAQRWPERSRRGISQADVDEMLATPPPPGHPDMVRRILSLHADHEGARIAGIKTPMFALHLPLLAAWFPEIRVVHLIRDGRDVAASMLSHASMPGHVVDAALVWQRSVIAGRQDGAGLGDRYLEVRYEDLVANPPGTLARITDHYGLPYDGRMLEYTDVPLEVAVRRREARELHQRVVHPPTHGLRDWRSELSRDQLELFEVVAGSLLDELGYPPSGVQPSRSTTARARGRTAITRVRTRFDLGRRLRRARRGT